jgi:formylglycine-generating enzyme required for sulfatase activity
MVCVPGGLFVLGHPVAIDFLRLRTTPERFVTVAPFAIDREEVKVGVVRALVASGELSSEPEVQSSDPTALFSKCTYLGRRSADNDAVPVNCIDHTLAAKVCAASGKRLPTEVEWEWAAGNLEEETTHPWGNDGDPCTWSDVGLAQELFAAIEGSAVCRVLPGRSSLPASVPSAGNPRDRTHLGIMALGGSLSEWVADRAANYDEACWRPDQPFLDNPRCDDGEAFSIRGSSWVGAPAFARVSHRQSAGAAARDPSIGFRCARSE